MRFPQLANREAYRHFYNEGFPSAVTEPMPFRWRYMRYFEPNPGETIVDLGCGTGASVQHYAQKGHICTGVDVSRTRLEVAEQEAERLTGKPQWVEAFIEDWEPDREYDWALVTEVLEHVIDPVPILKKAREAAKKVYITAPTILVGTCPHVRGVPVSDLREWLQEAGLHPWFVKTRGSILCGVRFKQVVAICSRS